MTVSQVAKGNEKGNGNDMQAARASSSKKSKQAGRGGAAPSRSRSAGSTKEGSARGKAQSSVPQKAPVQPKVPLGVQAANEQPPEPVSLREAQRLATREAIIHAAAEGFARLGYDQCSLEEIAGTAGVSKGLLLYHFNSKDELLTAVENKVFQGLLDYVKANTATVGPSMDQALWALDRAWELITSSRDFLSIYLQASLRARGGNASAAKGEGAGAFYARHRKVLVEGAATTLGPLVKSLPVDLESLADILLATLFGLALARMQSDDPTETDRSYANFRNLLKLAMGLK